MKIKNLADFIRDTMEYIIKNYDTSDSEVMELLVMYSNMLEKIDE